MQTSDPTTMQVQGTTGCRLAQLALSLRKVSLTVILADSKRCRLEGVEIIPLHDEVSRLRTAVRKPHIRLQQAEWHILVVADHRIFPNSIQCRHLSRQFYLPRLRLKDQKMILFEQLTPHVMTMGYDQGTTHRWWNFICQLSDVECASAEET